MKVRMGFVTNSSSSSFICKRCGETIEGWDWEEAFDHEEEELCINCYNPNEDFNSLRDVNDFINFLCEETNGALCKEKVIEIHKKWREKNE